ncbi:hypothetical protein [uncultured Sunxiuqinia sp.]|uniref:hypothetical protein n=1 Tax=uncultured Sunxiuqinia sp. TaxID=1573825 RepID=UPI00262754E1|nr:hypothetical protein [uncultured Sunxiuqinia sp.]
MTDFFRINMPYGLHRNDNGEWMAFNRENMPIGINKKTIEYDQHSNYGDLPVFTSYPRLSEEILLRLSADKGSIQRDKDGEINKIFLYNDFSNPVNNLKEVSDHFEKYWCKLRLLSTVCFRYPEQTEHLVK